MSQLGIVRYAERYMKNRLLRTIIVTSAEQRWTEKGATMPIRIDNYIHNYGLFKGLYWYFKDKYGERGEECD